jgi:hypothetical protein
MNPLSRFIPGPLHRLKPLLIADAGAAERKTQMHALFPVPDEQSTNGSDESDAEGNKDDQS